MSHTRTTSSVLVAAGALCLALSLAAPVIAAPSTAGTSADRAALARAIEKHDVAAGRLAQSRAKAAGASSRLDEALSAEAAALNTQRSWVVTTYRIDDTDFLWVMFDATTFEDFTTRWDVLMRITQQGAKTLEALHAARVEAQLSAEQLIKLQAEEIRAVDALAEEVARARKELATSEATLREYKKRVVAAAPPATKQPVKQPAKQPTGSGAWQTAVASHYDLNFTGRGASGENIGPYSMIVAHKTLPFGTLVEFEYNGKRAVAKVADRGPYTKDRTFDLGPGVIRVLGFSGVHAVRYRIITK